MNSFFTSRSMKFNSCGPPVSGVICFIAITMVVTKGGAVEPKAAIADTVPSSFSGTVGAGFFAMDAATFAKAPDALLADPAKLLAFLSLPGKESMARKISSGEIPIRDGAGKLEMDVKDRKFITGFSFTRDGIVPKEEAKSTYLSGTFLKVQLSPGEAESIIMRQDFRWVPEIGSRSIHGVARDIAVPVRHVIGCKSTVIIQKAQTVLAASWRSDVPPPGTEPGSHWQYLLFYTLR